MKENAPMDALGTIISTQILIVWILLGLLVAWMVLFALLALRPDPIKSVELEDFLVPTNPQLPAATPVKLLTVTPQPLAAHASMGQIDYEHANDIEVAPIG